MKLKREQAFATAELKETDKALKKAKTYRKHEKKVLTAIVSARAFTLPMLGHGRKNGGAQQNQKNRYEVLERVREVAELSLEQTTHWIFTRSPVMQQWRLGMGTNGASILQR